jgi:hypothetical protein
MHPIFLRHANVAGKAAAAPLGEGRRRHTDSVDDYFTAGHVFLDCRRCRGGHGSSGTANGPSIVIGQRKPMSAFGGKADIGN